LARLVNAIREHAVHKRLQFCNCCFEHCTLCLSPWRGFSNGRSNADYPDQRTLKVDLGKDRGLLPFTRTELECLRQCAQGKSDAQIGIEMELTDGEVASVLNVVMLKLRVPNRLAGLAKAGRLGLLEKVDI
jgi:DNA-binding NarL/FixJ family response regulator